jgi:hypothetical protein
MNLLQTLVRRSTDLIVFIQCTPQIISTISDRSMLSSCSRFCRHTWNFVWRQFQTSRTAARTVGYRLKGRKIIWTIYFCSTLPEYEISTKLLCTITISLCSFTQHPTHSVTQNNVVPCVRIVTFVHSNKRTPAHCAASVLYAVSTDCLTLTDILTLSLLLVTSIDQRVCTSDSPIARPASDSGSPWAPGWLLSAATHNTQQRCFKSFFVGVAFQQRMNLLSGRLCVSKRPTKCQLKLVLRAVQNTNHTQTS